MKRFIEEAEAKGEQGISHFGPEANLFEDLENLFRAYSDRPRARADITSTTPSSPRAGIVRQGPSLTGNPA